MAREDPPWTGPELEGLVGWLQYQRDTLALKCDGLTSEQLCLRSVPPSTMSLAGLVRHMAEVERSWFRRFIAGGGDAVGLLYCDRATNPDGDFDDVDPATVGDDFEAWAAEMAFADGLIGSVGLDETRYHERWEQEISMRWVMMHMIEEYARHDGHADLLRECIDGVTGD